MKNKNYKLWLILILIAATLLRLYKLAAVSLWHDEAFSALLINYSWKEMFYRIGLDVHPPVYYVLLRFWADVFGHSVFALRGFSVFFGVATVYATYLFVKSAFENEKFALSAALLMAVHPFQIQYVTEARMYTFGSFIIMFSCYLLSEAFKAQKRYPHASMKNPNGLKKIWSLWLLLTVATSLAMYTHYYLFFSVFAIWLFVVYYLYKNYKSSFKAWRFAISSYILVLIAYVPWLKTFLFQFRQVQNNYWIPAIDRWSIPLTIWKMLLGASADASKLRTDVILLAVCVFSVIMLWYFVKKQSYDYKWLVLLGLVVPFLGALALSIKQSIFLDRYFLFAALFYTIALAIFILEFRSKWIGYSLLVLAVIISFINWANNWRDQNPDQRPGLAAAALYLNQHVAKNDKLDIGSSFEFFNFKYYNQTGVPALLYTPGISKVTDLPHYSGTALLNDSDLIHDFNADTKPGDTTWLLWTNGFGGSKPQVPKNWVQIGPEMSWQDVRPYIGTVIYVDQYIVR